ncbi:hypothetical protein MLD52_09130 [Puniceicoccaceae bacterium K14]|nr:hypothetical protein [Puniceicoccaceae bacterium K14]
MVKLERSDLSSKVTGLTRGLKAYVQASGKDRDEALQKQVPKFNFFVKRQLRLVAPSKEDISLQALSAQQKRGSRKGAGKVIAEASTTDLASGAVLGLKIRPTVVAEARVKFGQASPLQGTRSFSKRANTARAFHNKHSGSKTKKVRRYGTVKRGGKDLSISAWMISREIAVRRSGRMYLAHGFGFKGFKASDKPTNKKIVQKDKFNRFASKLEARFGKTESSVRIVDSIPGTVTVDKRRRIITTGVNQVRADITTYLARKLLNNTKRIRSGRALR